MSSRSPLRSVTGACDSEVKYPVALKHHIGIVHQVLCADRPEAACRLFDAVDEAKRRLGVRALGLRPVRHDDHVVDPAEWFPVPPSIRSKTWRPTIVAPLGSQCGLRQSKDVCDTL